MNAALEIRRPAESIAEQVVTGGRGVRSMLAKFMAGGVRIQILDAASLLIVWAVIPERQAQLIPPGTRACAELRGIDANIGLTREEYAALLPVFGRRGLGVLPA